MPSSPPTPPGLSINALAQACRRRCARFCGIHFFNPPRYMQLVEIIATRGTDAATLDALETWLTSRLGKGVMRALDTPNFVANRIGVFSILAVMHHAAPSAWASMRSTRLTGPKIGRPKSATYRTAMSSASTRWPMSSRPCRTRCPTIPGTPISRSPAWLEQA
jgi:3-hydroxyacyl-CoA dehydrogenase